MLCYSPAPNPLLMWCVLLRTDAIVFAWSSRVNKCRNSSSDDSSRVGLWFPGLGLGKGAFAFDIGSKQPVWVVIAPVLGFLDSSLCFGSGRLSSWNSAPRLKSFNSSSSESFWLLSSLSLFERAPWPGLSTLIGLWYSSVRTRIKLRSPPLSIISRGSCLRSVGIGIPSPPRSPVNWVPSVSVLKSQTP